MTICFNIMVSYKSYHINAIFFKSMFQSVGSRYYTPSISLKVQDEHIKGIINNSRNVLKYLGITRYTPCIMAKQATMGKYCVSGICQIA